MKTIRFNTGRKYTQHGQRIVATLHADGVVTFFDHDRQVHGEFKLCGDRFDQGVVMDAYDRYIAKGTSRAWHDGMQDGGCNASLVEPKPQPEPEPVADPAATQIKVDPDWLDRCGYQALAGKWLHVTHIRRTTDGPYYTVEMPGSVSGRDWVVAGFRVIATAASVGNVSPVKLEQGHVRISQAEAALGRLTAGQRRDLLADSFPGWYLTTVRAVADAYPVEAKAREA